MYNVQYHPYLDLVVSFSSYFFVIHLNLFLKKYFICLFSVTWAVFILNCLERVYF